MTDRELLEKAAKAAGIHLLFAPDGVPRDCTGRHPSSNVFAAPTWNPLTDDGDALRLAVKLRLEVRPGTWEITAAGEGVWEEVTREGGDDAAAARRAIVRAAAAMASEHQVNTK